MTSSTSKCVPSILPLRRVDQRMGTALTQLLYGIPAAAVVDAVANEVLRLERLWSVFQPQSAISELARWAGLHPTAVSSETASVLTQAKLMYVHTEGAFDVTAGPLTALWRAAALRGELPQRPDIAEARALVGIDDLIIGDGLDHAFLLRLLREYEELPEPRHEHALHPRSTPRTGDLGRHGQPILRDPEVPEDATALIMESTYGDRLHPAMNELDAQLAAVVERTVRRGGKVIIPSFALERAQQLIFSLKKLRQAGKVPRIPVYVDSPLTVNLTQVFRLHPECYDAELSGMLSTGQSPFDFDGLRYVDTVEDSRAIDAANESSIIISASGMCEAGRVLHHLKAHIEDARNSVVIVGFQAQHTLGRRLVERRRDVRIFGVMRRLAAEVHVLNGFSAHADQSELPRFARAVRLAGDLKELALVHGENTAQRALRSELLAAGFSAVHTPKPEDTWTV